MSLDFDVCDYALHFNVVGPKAGLELILNVEKYENIPYFASDIGVQVSSHAGDCY